MVSNDIYVVDIINFFLSVNNFLSIDLKMKFPI